ncbi:MAG: fructose-6-phosphate aldolase [Humidesulfovibrio sp.]|uniref:fructose-6-phosphate aldolase n=1 Tax=Humidesulfovibrio sp. TaxID=2910988 RepID=UPI0027F4C526|nr:fructose-6-phosphate aldolase [Humidesulfovibrio sp.]MDQ7834438.1 fructose-6-phosphate aldolase [Humidesulfovibrio sp.]
MKIFLDTANLEQIRQANALGAIEGVTTNPSLLAKEKGDWRKTVRQICKEIDGPVSVEVIATESPAMLAEARDLVKIAPNVVVKVPVTLEGLKTIKELHLRGIETNATLVFSANQALLAAKAGATFVSPFIGRLDDIGHDGMQLVQDLVSIFRNYELPTQVLAASIRSASHFSQAALLGADAITIPLSVLLDLTKHPLTDIGLAKFLSDWAKK